MLSRLSIRNIVLIDKLDLDCVEGLTALTGETGAGKSILLDSLGLVLGSKAQTRLIRKDCDQASVTGAFDLNTENPAYSILEELEIEVSKGEPLIVKRILSADGKNKAFLNDEPITLKNLQKIGAFLCDIHGQFDTHKLLNEKSHIHLVDQFSQNYKLIDDVASYYKDYRQAKTALIELEKKAEEARRQEDYLRFVLNELEEANPQEDEGDYLEGKRIALKNQGKYREALDLINNALSSEQGADQQISNALSAFNRLPPEQMEHPTLAKLSDRLMSIQTEMGDILFELERFAADQDGDHDSLEEIEIRLLHLKDLARKHQCQVNDLVEIEKNIKSKIGLIDDLEAQRLTLQKQLQEKRAAFVETAQKLSDHRKKSAHVIDQNVMKELKPLKMERAIFKTLIEPKEDESAWSRHGIDNVAFQIATNPGHAPGPLNKIASGGEMSRFMLALKVVLADADPTETLIFDEVDAGIGGPTADAVGQRLKTLGKSKQVMVVTHSPQVAANAQTHFYVEKTVKDSITNSDVRTLNNNERLLEIARMLSGAEITQASKQAASALLGFDEKTLKQVS